MKFHSIYDLTAIEIGVSSRNWEYMHEDDSRDPCISFMVKNKYDILPLKNIEGKFNNFLVTNEWNHFDKIEKKHKSLLPKLRADSDFISIMKEFIEKKEKYFLLYQGATIVGILSIVHFYYKEIYKRLYNLLAELEIQLADWLFKKIDQDEAFEILLKKSQSENSKTVLGQYLIDKQTGYDGHMKEYLYLSSLHSIIRDKELFKQLGFLRKDWNELASPLFETRNSVAHPVRSIIREKKDFERILITLVSARKILSQLMK